MIQIFRRVWLGPCSAVLSVTVACGDDATNESSETSSECGDNARLSAQDVCVCRSGFDDCEPDDPQSGCCETEEPAPPRDPYCADGICNGQKTPANCPRDCTEDADCGDGTCQPSETPANCAQDCVTPPVCGNGVCETGETTATCSADCAPRPVCGNGTCETGETTTSCSADCAPRPVCGDGFCEPLESETCPSDCGSMCDGLCRPYDNDICPEDCSDTLCRDGVCDLGESPYSCREDCYTARPHNYGATSLPDVVIFAVSGHCFLACPGGFLGLNSVNKEYLEAESDGIEQLAGELRRRGRVVNVWYYADELYDRTNTGNRYHPSQAVIRPDHYGFLSLLMDLAATRDRVFDYDRDRRPWIILAAHSHGTVWAHSAAMLMRDFPIDFLVDLDGESARWQTELAGAGDDWGNEIFRYEDTYFMEFPWRIQDWLLGDAPDFFDIPGRPVWYDLEDVAPDNVWVNLEVAADITVGIAGTFTIQDSELNYRFDGTRIGIERYYATGESHGAVHQSRSNSMTWVIGRIIALMGL